MRPGSSLSDLITAAMVLAGEEDKAAHGGRIWHFEGGRSCPLGWGDCSQSVYVDLASGEYDYGDPGGPGHHDCERYCRHGLEQAPEMESEAA